MKKGASGILSLVLSVVFITGTIAPAFAQIVTPPVTPPADTTPPVISAIVAVSVSSVAESVTWVTNELSVSTFEYGTTTGYGSTASISASAAIGGTAALTGLAPATTYYYCIHSTDTSGNTSSACGQSFTTAAAPDATAPILSAIVVTSLTTTTATITWTTSEAATAQVAYGTTSSYGSTSSLDNNLALTHSATLTGLAPNTTYHYQIRSTDAAGNLATSTDATFTTESIQVVIPPDTTPPVISSISTASVSNVAATITWTTNELATSTLVYGTTMSYGTEATIPASALLAHEAALINLSPQTTYYYCIYATDVAGNTSNSCGHSFTTGSTPDTTPPIISNISEASVSPYDETIAWSTNELATSSIRYGTGANNLSLTLPVSESAGLVHEATILSLASGTTYYYCVDATDLAGNAAHSCGHSFTTGIASSSPPPDTTPPTISLVTVAPIATSTASVTWTTSEVANGEVEYGTSTAYGSSAGLDTDFALTDEANLAGLIPNTTYHYRIRSSDQVGNIAYSNDNTFTTGALPVVNVTPTPRTTPPVISGLATSSVGESTATIAWTTDEAAVSTMSYGTSLSYGSVAALSANALLDHVAVLTGLAPSTTYYYCIHATDFWGNAASDCGQTFTTAAAPLPPDTTPPIISGVAQESVASYDTTVVWSTNELATSSIRYGTSTNYGRVLPIGASAGLVHSGTLAGLSAATTYYYCIDATDLAGNTASSCEHSFTTAAAPIVPDTTPPVISVIAAASLATSTATITWTTSELANSQIEYGTSTSYGSTSPLNITLALTHSESLSGLLPATIYHYRVISADTAGNIATSTDATFTTESLPQIPPQEIINPIPTSTSTPSSTPNVSSTINFSAIEMQSVGTSTVTITWNTDLPASAQVEYGTSEQLGSATPLSTSTLSTSHSVMINGLEPNTNYIFRVASTPSGANEATLSTNYEFNTLAMPIFTSTPANVSAVTATSVATSTADIMWITDQNASAEVQYGISTEYGQNALSSGVLATSHTIGLSDLTPDTIYHYRVKSVNASGDITFSNDDTFMTTALNILSIPSSTPIIFGPGPVSIPVVAPMAVSDLSVAAYDPTSATLTWNVSSANADAAAEYDVRYSTSPITQNNFESATQDQVTAILYPDLEPNGIARTYIVAGLEASTTYYFAITSKYEASASAPISNVATVTTERVGVPEVVLENNSGGIEGGSSGSVSAGGGGGGGGGTGAGASGGAISGPVGSPTLTNAAGEDSQITLNWNNPGTNSFVRTIVVKKEGSYPTSPTDGQVIYDGNGGTFTDSNVSNGTTYYYALYSYDRAKNYSPGINVSIAPQAGVNQIQLNENPTITTGGPSYHFTQVFDQGDTDVEVAHLQEMLARYNVYPENYVTSYFGPLTEAALKKFQALHGIPQTGMTDAQTQILLNAASLSDQSMNVPQDLAVFDTDLQLGMTSEDVGELQQFLIYEGDYPEAQVTGYFGTLTQDAVIDFQTKYGILPAVGYVGPITRHTIATISGF